MILYVFSVVDKTVGAYLPPFYARSRGEALRSFSDAVNDPSHQFAKHLTDYCLMEMGTWDDQSGIFMCGEPVRVLSALECVNSVSDRPGASSRANGSGVQTDPVFPG